MADSRAYIVGKRKKKSLIPLISQQHYCEISGIVVR